MAGVGRRGGLGEKRPTRAPSAHGVSGLGGRSSPGTAEGLCFSPADSQVKVPEHGSRTPTLPAPSPHEHIS